MTTVSQAAKPDILTPHSVEAEEGVLGAVLMNPDAWWEVSNLTPRHFFIVRNGWVFAAFKLLIEERHEPVDYLTVMGVLSERGQLEELGGTAYLLRLINATPSSLNAKGYAGIVRRTWERRQLIAAASKIAQIASNGSENPVREALRVVRDDFPAPADNRLWGGKGEALGLEDLLAATSGLLVPVLIPGLQRAVRHVERGTLTSIGGVGGGGKSSLIDQWAEALAQDDYRALTAHTEMLPDQMRRRRLQRLTGIPHWKLVEPDELSDNEREIMLAACCKTPVRPSACRYPPLEEWENNLLYLHAYEMTVDEILVYAARVAEKDGLDWLAIDYFQMLKLPWRNKGEREDQAMDAALTQLKGFAQEYGVAVVLTSQFSRAQETAANMTKEKVIGEDAFRGSAGIFHRSNVSITINRPKVGYDDDQYKFTNADGMMLRDVPGKRSILARVAVVKDSFDQEPEPLELWFDGPRLRFLERVEKVRVGQSEPGAPAGR